jgi:hypothetical protein
MTALVDGARFPRRLADAVRARAALIVAASTVDWQMIYRSGHCSRKATTVP